MFVCWVNWIPNSTNECHYTWKWMTTTNRCVRRERGGGVFILFISIATTEVKRLWKSSLCSFYRGSAFIICWHSSSGVHTGDTISKQSCTQYIVLYWGGDSDISFTWKLGLRGHWDPFGNNETDCNYFPLCYQFSNSRLFLFWNVANEIIIL